MKATDALAACWMAVAVAASAAVSAEPPRLAQVHTVAAKPKPSTPTTHRASSFAPHAGSKRRVYGTPIQPRIAHRLKSPAAISAQRTP